MTIIGGFTITRRVRVVGEVVSVVNGRQTGIVKGSAEAGRATRVWVTRGLF